MVPLAKGSGRPPKTHWSSGASRLGTASSRLTGSRPNLEAPIWGTATCDIDGDTGTTAYIDCGSEQTRSGYPAGLIVKVLVDPDAEEKVKVVDAGEGVDHNN